METIEKILLILGILALLSAPISAKYFATTELPKLVEEDGFCKKTYGDNWKFSEKKLDCYNLENNTERHSFTDAEFRKVCPRVNFFEPKFYSDCFHKGDSR